jgi:hypothetical protein
MAKQIEISANEFYNRLVNKQMSSSSIVNDNGTPTMIYFRPQEHIIEVVSWEGKDGQTDHYKSFTELKDAKKFAKEQSKKDSVDTVDLNYYTDKDDSYWHKQMNFKIGGKLTEYPDWDYNDEGE